MKLRLLRSNSLHTRAGQQFLSRHGRRRGDHPDPRVVEGFVTPDQLFATLDGRVLIVAKRRHRIEIFGISDVDGHRWIQLAITGRRRVTLTLKLAPGDGEQRVVLVLSSWLANPAEAPEVLNAS